MEQSGTIKILELERFLEFVKFIDCCKTDDHDYFILQLEGLS